MNVRRRAIQGFLAAAFAVPLMLSASAVRADAEHAVEIRSFVFNPGTLTVSVGDTVTWTNFDAMRHTATGSSFDSGLLAQGESFSVTFTEAGTYNYQCTPHPWMLGRIVVEADSIQPSDGQVPNTSMDHSHGTALLGGGIAILALAGAIAIRRRAPADR